MCDQWQNTALLDLNPHILACVKCLYRKLDQFKQSSDENKEKMKQMKKTKDGLKAQIDELIPDRTDEHNIRILESIKVMVINPHIRIFCLISLLNVNTIQFTGC